MKNVGELKKIGKADFDKPTFPRPPSDTEKYSYVNPSSWGLSLTSLFLLVAFGVGSYLFVLNDPRLLSLYAVFAVIASLGMLWNAYLYLIVKKLDVDWRDRKRVWFLKESSYCPTVDVYLPSAGEDLDLLDSCYYYVSCLEYSNYKVWVLDDSGRPEVQKLASRYGFEYICRPEPRELKKSGNLRYAFPRTEGELILVLDADMCPRPDMLDEMVWEFGKYPTLGLLQTPHYFRVERGQSRVATGASLMQELFFRVAQPAWNIFGAAICCGSNALYRREGLLANGGPARIERSEDVATSLVIIKAGYKVKYLPLCLAAGLSPETLRSFVNQLSRWSGGAYQTRTSSFLWNKYIPIHIKLIYCSSVVYFLTAALGVVGFGFPGVINLLFFPENIWFSNYFFILPAVFLSILAKKQWSSLHWDLSILYAAFIIGYISLISTYDFLRGDLAGWVPTNQPRAKGESYSRFISCMRWIPAIGLTLCLAGIFKNWMVIEPWAWAPALLFWLGKFWVSRMVLIQDEEEESIDKIYRHIEAYTHETNVKTHYASLKD